MEETQYSHDFLFVDVFSKTCFYQNGNPFSLPIVISKSTKRKEINRKVKISEYKTYSRAGDHFHELSDPLGAPSYINPQRADDV